MLLREYIEEVCDGYIDKDVADTEVDLWVCMVYDLSDGDSDIYNKFLKWLVDHVEVARDSGDTLICNFSKAFKPYNDKLKDFFNMEYSEFDEEEAYYEAVVNLEPLISGNATDGQYIKLLECLQ